MLGMNKYLHENMVFLKMIVLYEKCSFLFHRICPLQLTLAYDGYVQFIAT